MNHEPKFNPCQYYYKCKNNIKKYCKIIPNSTYTSQIFIRYPISVYFLSRKFIKYKIREILKMYVKRPVQGETKVTFRVVTVTRSDAILR